MSEITEIAAGVFVFPHRLVDGKNGIVVGRRGALAVDACNYRDEGDAMVACIRDLGEQPDRLAYTHGHGDHVLGSAAFAGAEVYAHAATNALIDSHIPRIADRYFAGSQADASAAILRPTVTFTEDLLIDLGGKLVRMSWLPGHSPDSAVVFVEPDGVLFGGDSVVTGIVPAITDGDSRALESGLRRLLDWPIETLVPGHGPVIQGALAAREAIGWIADYLAGIRTAVQAGLAAGGTDDQVAESVLYERHVGDRLSPESHGMRRRHRTTVDVIVAEELRSR